MTKTKTKVRKYKIKSVIEMTLSPVLIPLGGAINRRAVKSAYSEKDAYFGADDPALNELRYEIAREFFRFLNRIKTEKKLRILADAIGNPDPTILAMIKQKYCRK